MKSDIIIHLAQWQYWWWFWFAFVWTLYFFFISRAVRLRTLKMRPKINTSYRSHGKWGDFLACVLPTIWCLNILTNSSFILRLIEWQNESSLFTIRIRGRQWYWVYKFELRHIVDVMSAPKNIGNNQWVVSTGGSIEATDSYFYALRLRKQNLWLASYWENYVRALSKPSLGQAMSALSDQPRHGSMLSLAVPRYSIVSRFSRLLSTPGLDFVRATASPDYLSVLNSKSRAPVMGSRALPRWSLNTVSSAVVSNSKVAGVGGIRDLVNYSVARADNFEPSRFVKRNFLSAQPLLVSKSFSNLERLADMRGSWGRLAAPHFNKERSFVSKVQHDQTFLVFKQKRYKRKKVIPERTQHFKDAASQRLSRLKISDRPSFSSISFLESISFKPTSLYRAMKKNRVRHENTSVSLSRRLLRTKKTLVVPAHVNLTLITNSYDVVHSWFIPGMGIKLDCVPGRSTHHVFYCDNVGFYYGQCAEICGRYHHHMPIRLCALPFEHFVVWWQHFGLNKLLFSLNKKRYESKLASKTFCW